MPQSLPSPQPINYQSVAEDDRRSTNRQRRRVGVTWRLLAEKNHLMTAGEVHDLSKVGLALRLDAPVRPGVILVIKLDEALAGLEEPFLVRIKHVSALEEGGWLAGCSFTRKFTDAEFATLLSVSTEPEPEGLKRPCGKRENRGSPRQGLENSLPIRIKPVNMLRSEVVGRLKDRSRGGLGLVSLAAFPAGTILNIRTDLSDVAPWVQVRVKHCRPHQRQWILGCQFIDKPGPASLEQFADQNRRGR